LIRDGEVVISPQVVGYRSAFIGAVLRTLPRAAVGMDPPRVWLEDTKDDAETSAARRRRRQRDEAALIGQLLEAITGLRRWTREGRAAVHKPLLLLLALERVRRGLPRLVSFVEVEPQLRALITEFSSTPSHPEYPFWRLQADGLWDVPEASQLPSRASNSDPPVSVLRARGVQGGLPIHYDELLRARGDVLDQAVTTTLQYFPVELRPRVLERLGWDDIPTRPAERPRGSEQTAPLGMPYRQGSPATPRPSGVSYQPDPDKVGRGVEGHERTLRALVGAVQTCGLEPLLPGSAGPSYDLAWETETAIFVAEVKSLTLANEERQLRLGLGQVLRYWHALSNRPKPVIAVLAVEERPADESWLALADRLGVWLLWPESMPAALADAVEAREHHGRGEP
jgi:hypothetical protein